MEAMNRQIVDANIKLQDENKVLKEDKKILQKRIENAIELINLNICGGSISNANNLLKILKGEYINE